VRPAVCERIGGRQVFFRRQKVLPKVVAAVCGDNKIQSGEYTDFGRLGNWVLSTNTASGTPAWQRLQAVRAIEAYRDIVLGTTIERYAKSASFHVSRG